MLASKKKKLKRESRTSAFNTEYERTVSPFEKFKKKPPGTAAPGTANQSPMQQRKKMPKKAMKQFMPRILYEGLPGKEIMPMKNYIASIAT